MPTKDTSQTTRVRQKRAHVLGNFHIDNPRKQINGPRGTTPSSVLTEMKLYQGLLESSALLYVEDIATFVIDDGSGPVLWGDTWLLNGAITIKSFQTLTIRSGETVRTTGHSLTNTGTMNISGQFRVVDGSLSNSGTINIAADGSIPIAEEYGLDTILINGGVINNSGYLYAQTGGVIFNTGTINNSGLTQFNSAGTFKNTGLYNNNSGGELRLTAGGGTGMVYNYAGGQINNGLGATIANGGTINNADGSGSCGTGILVNNGTINSTYAGQTGTIGTACPP